MDQVNSLSRVELDSKTEFKVNMEKWIDSMSFEFCVLKHVKCVLRKTFLFSESSVRELASIKVLMRTKHFLGSL